ncbi:unnamed protein product [Ixodes persulcatus]
MTKVEFLAPEITRLRIPRRDASVFFFFFNIIYFYIYSKFPFLFNNFLLSFENVETFGGGVIFCANLCCCPMKKVLFPFPSSKFYSFKYSHLLSILWSSKRYLDDVTCMQVMHRGHTGSYQNGCHGDDHRRTRVRGWDCDA